MGLVKEIPSWVLPVVAGQKRPVLTLGRQSVEKTGLYLDELWGGKFKDLIHSLDIDSYENPTYTADLCNLSLELHKYLSHKFAMVIDGGTIEHTADPVTALMNALDFVEVGGRFCSVQFINLSGHGFWCLSPELIVKYMIQFGFCVDRVYVKSILHLSPWREINVSLLKTERQEIISLFPIVCVITGRKVDSFAKNYSVNQCPALPPRNSFYHWLWRTRLWRFPRVRELKQF